MNKYLIVGLGNIGEQYKNTRHNIGFKILDEFAFANTSAFETNKLGCIARLKQKGKIIILLKPSTFMNLSGKAVNYWLQKEKVSIDNLLIITDDLNLSFGILRLKTKGSDGGHNGLKDIQSTLNTSNYSRLRFGISNSYSKGKQVDYVLGKWHKDENLALNERLEKTTEIISSFVLSGSEITMNKFNGK